MVLFDFTTKNIKIIYCKIACTYLIVIWNIRKELDNNGGMYMFMVFAVHTVKIIAKYTINEC